MDPALSADVAAVQAIGAIPKILQTVSDITGLRFACVARVTPDSWVACAVLDQIDLGVRAGDSLDIATTLCKEVRASRMPIVIDAVSTDPHYCQHHTPKLYGFESYISVPIVRSDGEYFGTLCGLDPLPTQLSDSAALSAMTLFASLISQQLENEERLDESQVALSDAQQTAELREQFIAVLGHDLRNPLSSIVNGAEILLMSVHDEKLRSVVKRIQRSGHRIASLVDDVMDFTRGQMGGGIALKLRAEADLNGVFRQVVAELQSAYPEREIVTELAARAAIVCDPDRLAQLCSNLLKNALVYGASDRPVSVTARCDGDALELSVSNHGPAIPEATASQLFKPYWRAAAKAPHEGLGLGLFIVAEIARSHGGQIEVQSTDALTSFIFRLPGTRV